MSMCITCMGEGGHFEGCPRRRARRSRRRPLHVDTRAVMCVVCRRTWRMLVVEREVARGRRMALRTVCAGCCSWVDTQR